MDKFFSMVLNMSITGTIVILVVLVVRMLLKRSPKIYSYILWAAVLFRLLCPVSLSAPISVLASIPPEVQETSETASIVYYIPAEQQMTTVITPGETMPVAEPESPPVLQEDSRQNARQLASYVWIAGMAIMILHSAVQYYQLRRRVVGAALYRGNIYLADHIDMPFVLGILAPRIYLPSGIPVTERKYIIAHERHHIRRLDHIIKMLAYIALCIHWFNPFAWVAFILAGRDMEMSCDEAVIQRMGSQVRADYSACLLRLATHRKIIAGTPLAFGEGDTKGRVHNMAKWKKPRIWISILCILICISVLTICSLNPSERAGDSSTKVKIGDFSFTLPEGYTAEETMDAQPKSIAIQKSGLTVGGVYQLEYPDEPIGRSFDWVEALNIPENVPEDRFIMYTHIEDGKTQYVAYGKNGIEERLHYLIQKEDHVYDLWFDMEILTESDKVEILNAATDDNAVPYALSHPFNPLKGFPDNITTRPEKNGDYVILDQQRIVGGIRVRPVPEGYSPDEYFGQAFLQALGIEEASNESLGYYADGTYTNYTIEFFSDVPPGQERTVHTFHQFYTTRDEYIIDIWFDLLSIDNSLKDQILASVDIPEINRIRGGNDAYENTIASDMIDAPLFSISKLPDGYTRDFLSSDCALIIRKDFVVAGVNVFPIPQDVYDPNDKSFLWLEKMGLADFEDPELCYMGGITSGDNGWAAEFASDVPEGSPVTVHRRHTYRVIGTNLYDIWTDLTVLDYNEAQEITAAVQLPQLAETEEKQVDRSAEEIAFEKTAAIMDVIADGSSGILQKQIQDSNEGPKAYERKYYFHDGNLLHTSTMLPEGVNQTDAGDYCNRYAFLFVNEEAYDNTGHQGEPGDIIWSSAQIPEVFPTPWLGNHIWNKSYVTYIDTMEVEEGECLMFRYDAMYADIEGYAPVYWVNFYFDHNGSFLYVSMDVNLFQNNAFTITESILTMDPAAVEAEIHKEYQRAINK